MAERRITIRSVLDDHRLPKLADLAERVKERADVEWDAASQAASKGDDRSEDFHRGKAHALCEVLGDQEGLWWLIEEARKYGTTTGSRGGEHG